MNVRRVAWAASGLITAVALVAGGWVAANAFTSPAQWEARASAPPPAPILAEVTRGDLVDDRTLGATVVPESEASVPLAPTQGAVRSIVTESLLAVGSEVTVGTVLVRVNGEPTFAVASPFPFYRDLGIGDEGPDVRVLQQNLQALGLIGSVDGRFGPATARAVAALFISSDSTVPKRDDPARADASADSGETDGAESRPPNSSAYLPLSSVAAAPTLPARLAGAPAVGADVAAGVAVRLTSEEALLRVSMPGDLAQVLAPGAEVKCSAGGDELAPCRVARVFRATADAAGIGGGDQEFDWVDVVPVGTSIDPEQAGQSGSIQLRVATLAEDSLLVPSLGVAQQDARSGVIVRQEADGTFTEVRVTVIAALKGRMAIVGDLEPGDRIRVG